MNIEPSETGWTFDESVGWKLIHDGYIIIFYEHTDKAVSTQAILFIGTEEECEAEIARLELTWVHELDEETQLD
jgi:hypothetical protein